MPQVDISQELAERLQKIMHGDNLNQLAEAALTEWAGWLDGSARPSSMSELETRRIVAIYETILADDLPSADHIGRVFDLPMGRARYIVQSIAYRHGALIRSRRFRTILKALQGGTWSNNDTICIVNIDPAFQNTIDAIMKKLVIEEKIESPVRGNSTLEGVRYSFGRNHYQALVDALNEYLEDS